MTDRLLDFSESPASLSTENGLLVIRLPGQPPQTVPIADVGALVASHRQVVFTQNLVAALAREGAPLICCDERHLPAAMLLPLDAHFAQAERFQAQAAASLPARKRLWKEIVSLKIVMQARALLRLNGEDAGVLPLARKVRSGDPDNLEAVAAQRYWPRVFGDPQFRRGNGEDPRNAMLNYGYAVVRAAVARAICASGLHPSLGVNHRNRYNAFCLADDLMEPLRPLVDERVVRMCRGLAETDWGVSKQTKPALLNCLAARYLTGGEKRTLFDIAGRWAQNLASVYLGQRQEIGCEPLEPVS
jgi:CRISPR-associated protein Cas1